MSRRVDSARKQLSKARADLDKWRARDVELATVQDEIEANAGDRLLDDAGAESAVADSLSSVVAQRRVVSKAVDQARTRVLAAGREVLLAEAADEDDEAAGAEKDRRAVQAKVEVLLAQLQGLNGANYRVVTVDDIPRSTGQVVTAAVPLTEQLEARARQHRVRASVLRHVAASGRVPTFLRELDLGVVSPFLIDGDLIPDTAREFDRSESEATA